MKYLQGSFTVGTESSQAYRDNYDRTFRGENPPPNEDPVASLGIGDEAKVMLRFVLDNVCESCAGALKRALRGERP